MPMLTTYGYEVWSRVTDSGEVLARHGDRYGTKTAAQLHQTHLTLEQYEADHDAMSEGRDPSGVEYFLVRTRTTREEEF